MNNSFCIFLRFIIHNNTHMHTTELIYFLLVWSYCYTAFFSHFTSWCFNLSSRFNMHLLLQVSHCACFLYIGEHASCYAGGPFESFHKAVIHNAQSTGVKQCSFHGCWHYTYFLLSSFTLSKMVCVYIS